MSSPMENGSGQPHYVSAEPKEREAILSQTGTFNPTEREIFHKLCRVWERAIPYNRFLALINAEYPNSVKEVERIMEKLKKARMGLIMSVPKNGVRSAEHIILTTQDSLLFWSKLLDEELMGVLDNIGYPLPSSRSLQDQGMKIPPEMVQEANWETLFGYYKEKEITEPKIFSVAVGDGEDFLISATSFKRFVTIALAKLQYYFQNANLLSAVAARRNVSLSDLKRMVSGKDLGFWRDICDTLLLMRKDLEAQRKFVVDHRLFPTAQFMADFIKAQAEDLRTSKKRKEERELDLKTLEETIKSAPERIIDHDSFSRALLNYKDKYGDEFNSFKDEFESRYLTSDDPKKSPKVLHVQDVYVHQDHLYPVFVDRVLRLEKKLHSFYTTLMIQYLKGRISDAGLFVSKDNFEYHLSQQVGKEDQLLDQLLQRPAAVAESLFLLNRKADGATDKEEIKRLLSTFFQADKIAFLDYIRIFNLSLSDMFQDAYLALNIFRQIMMKLTGRFKNERDKFYEMTKNAYGSSAAPQAGAQRSITVRSGTSDEKKRESKGGKSLSALERSGRIQGVRKSAKGNRPGSGYRNASNSIGNKGSAGTGSKPSPQKIEKQYSAQEQENAWKEFSKSLKS